MTSAIQVSSCAEKWLTRMNFIILTTMLFAMSAVAQGEFDSTDIPTALLQLKHSAVAMRSGNPSDTDFSDLYAINSILRSVDLVLLGEQSHGEGSVYGTKTRLIKFLHEQMGFDVLAFESSFFGCAKAQDQIGSGMQVEDAISSSVYSLWSSTSEFQPLIEYIRSTAKTSRPLVVAGFDSRMVTSLDRQYLLSDLEEHLRSTKSSVLQKPFWYFARTTIDSLMSRERSYLMTTRQWDSLVQGIRDIQHELKTSATPSARTPFWTKVLDNVLVTGRVLPIPLSDWKKGNSLRDQQLADNLLWLMKEQYPGKKIVAWTASYHAARRLDEITQSGVKPYDSVQTMGGLLHAALGSRLYSAAFTAYCGSYSDWSGEQKSVDTAFVGTLEDVMNQVGFERALFDLRGLPETSPLATKESWARPTGYAWRPAIWPRHFDAMIFERNVTPSTKLRK